MLFPLKHVSGWWFGTCFIFPYIENVIIPIDFHIFRRGRVQTTSQKKVLYIFPGDFKDRYQSLFTPGCSEIPFTAPQWGAPVRPPDLRQARWAKLGFGNYRRSWSCTRILFGITVFIGIYWVILLNLICLGLFDWVMLLSKYFCWDYLIGEGFWICICFFGISIYWACLDKCLPWVSISFD